MAEGMGSCVARHDTTNRLLAALLYALSWRWRPLRRALRKFGFKLSRGLSSGWDVGRLGTEFINQVVRVDQLQAADAAERERRADIERRRDAARRNRNRRH